MQESVAHVKRSCQGKHCCHDKLRKKIERAFHKGEQENISKFAQACSRNAALALEDMSWYASREAGRWRPDW